MISTSSVRPRRATPIGAAEAGHAPISVEERGPVPSPEGSTTSHTAESTAGSPLTT
ncbi:hypothetical protein [Streptomyces sp. TP-A0356]|uniref:hypothetical protein n=1 Tax=Streptomyces sp. TP-A0356 TaxID=1359208 RepID=UPI0018FEDE69